MARANGKVILCGEHAVVYGVPAIAASIALGANADARLGAPARLSLGQQQINAGDGSELGRAFVALIDALGVGPAEVRLSLSLPAGCGLGASAAMAVATARAVLDAAEGSVEPSAESPRRRERVLAAALAWERIFHGNPSGIDTAAAAATGCISFTKQDGAKHIALAEPLLLAIAIAGPPASTKQMVDSVARLKARKPEIVEKALAGIASVVENARLCLEAGDVHGLGKLLDLNHMLLAGLHLSTEEIESACRLARDAGALGAKLTGAGGGGAVIALCEASASAVLEAWRARGLTAFETRVEAA